MQGQTRTGVVVAARGLRPHGDTTLRRLDLAVPGCLSYRRPNHTVRESMTPLIRLMRIARLAHGRWLIWRGPFLSLAMSAAVHVQAQEPPNADADTNESYLSTVWADAKFDATGRLAELKFVDQANYPAAFSDTLRARLQKAQIKPVLDDGQPASFQTGLALGLRVTPAADGSATVAITGLRITPLIIKRYSARLPNEYAHAKGWSGQMKVTCTVDTNGRCDAVQVEALPGVPESARRWAKESIEGYEFQPQRVNDRPVVGETAVNFKLSKRDAFPEDFRIPKFDRLQWGR